MPKQKFTVILLPDEDCYQVFFPHYPDCITFGVSVPEALQRAQEALELTLKSPLMGAVTRCRKTPGRPMWW